MSITGFVFIKLAPKTKPKAENAEPSVKSPKAAKDGAKKPSKAGMNDR